MRGLYLFFALICFGIFLALGSEIGKVGCKNPWVCGFALIFFILTCVLAGLGFGSDSQSGNNTTPPSSRT